MSFDRIIQQYVDEVLEHNKNHKSCHNRPENNYAPRKSHLLYPLYPGAF